jgi:phosphoribosylglycinamide formyltransferase 1
MIRVAIISSTMGSVMSSLLPLPYFSQRIACLITDRECGALDVASRFGIPSTVIATRDSLEFSNALADRFEHEHIDLFISFYKRLFKGRFLEQARGRLINLHPSILPACPGRDGFGDTVRAGSRFIGATAHYVDHDLDTGCPIIQSACPYNPYESMQENRHKVFVHQCKMLLQVLDWCEQDRLHYDADGRSHIRDGIYRIGEFAPALEHQEAIGLHIPFVEEKLAAFI